MGEAVTFAAAESLELGDHAVAWTSSDDQRRRLATAFVRQGVRRRDRVLYLTRRPPEAVPGDLGRGLAARQVARPGQVQVRPASDLFAPDRTFRPDRMVRILREQTDRALEEGYGGLRLFVEVAWVLDGIRHARRRADLERDVNEAMRGWPTVFLCQYDVARFGPDLLAGAAASHPVVHVHPDGDAGTTHLRVTRAGGTLRLEGEVDVTNLGVLRKALAAGRPVLLDLAALASSDVAACRAIAAALSANGDAASVTLRHPPPAMERILDVLELAGLPHIRIEHRGASREASFDATAGAGRDAAGREGREAARAEEGGGP